MKITNEEFLLKIKTIYKDRDYNYDKTKYTGSHNKVIITCSVHGDFEIEPRMIYKNKGCPFCEKRRIVKNGNRNKTTELFIKEANLIHKRKYNYNKTNYIRAHDNVIITCPIHGDFELTPTSHLKGCGCPKCGREKANLSESILKSEFLVRSNNIHNNKYDYSKVNYVNYNTPVTIICPIHGEFLLTPKEHLKGCGCPKCIGRNKTTEEWIKEAQKIHGDKYDYSLTKYIKSHDKVYIICPEHGGFWQEATNHLMGQGCPLCKLSKGEITIINFLKSHNINYKYDYKITVPKEIRPTRKIRVDFYLPDYNYFIEYNGKLHYMPIEYFGGLINFEKLLNRDNYLRDYSNKNGIKLIEISYAENIIECLKNQLL